MRHTIFTTLLLLLATTMTAQEPPQEQASAPAELTPQQWRDSLAVLNRLITAQPQSTDFRLKKAAVNIELKQWEYAIEEYGNVLRLEPRNLAALFFRAYAHTTLRHYAQARADYETFLSIAPIHLEARLGLAKVCERMGRTTDAMDELNRTVQMFPDSAVVYAARALLEDKLNMTEPALYDWSEAIRRDGDNMDYVASKADLLQRMGRKKEAQRELDAIIRQGRQRR